MAEFLTWPNIVVKERMFDKTKVTKEYCEDLVRNYPITVERYDSGQYGFIARPMHDGRRHNKSFATSKWGTPENCAAQAIKFCKEVSGGAHRERIEQREQYPIPAAMLPQLSHLVKTALKLGVDPIKVLRQAITTAFQDQIK